MITIYHNPRCSKSREALAMAEQFSNEHKLKLDIVDYQKTPLTLAQLKDLHWILGGPVGAMLRDSEPEYAALGLAQADDVALLAALAAHPKLLQRPIVVYLKRAVIARPPQLLDQLFEI
ncbi:arsenate reductase [Collimonas sp. PA-H2]|uniref:ArsC/Spx/MgsR family protein n=1 Tax=Collimonas sp. PA-H2 TaxID=1881062 RepID=UPI000BF9BE2A|nr:ArsC/Spx/MgsR family protein [Collimonas sp. PA-H2]PFH10147.1 arsenate reductase [Collimonas sp. PA-H2]